MNSNYKSNFSIIDIHCHCLPGIDDGPADLKEAIGLCRLLADEGVVDVVATPHQLGPYRGRNNPADLRLAIAALQQELIAAGVDLRIHAGADIRVDDDVMDLLANDEIMTVGDARRWVLLEMPTEICFDIEELLQELGGRSIRAVFTHPERFPWIDQYFPQILRWRQRHGMLLQVTAGSLVGAFGQESEARAWRWLETGLVDVVASDAHNCGARPPRLMQAATAISERLGEKVAERVLSIAPGRILG